MKLDGRKVIDQLTSDRHAAEIEDRLNALDIAILDARLSDEQYEGVAAVYNELESAIGAYFN